MKNYKFLILIILFAFSLPCMYGGCVVIYSSGGFDGIQDQKDDKASQDYDGLTSQAAITQLNAEALAAGAFAGGLSNNSTAPQSLKLSRRSNSAQIKVFRPLRYPLVLADGLRRIESDAELNISGLSNVVTESNNLKGGCGGEVTYTLTFDRLSGNFSGDLLFADYCDDGVVISGDTDIDGTFEARSGVFNTATFTFDDLADDFHTLDGEITLDLADTPLCATLTAYSKDSLTGEVYWLKNYSLNLFEFFDRVEIETFGTFYHPDNGFVRLTTSEPFIVFEDDDWPASGQLLLQGDSDTAAHLIALDRLHFRVEADTNGDGIFEWDSGLLDWTNF